MSDTILFKSPTCTRYDIDLAEYLAKLAEVSLTDLGNVMFSSEASADKPVEEFMYSDFKEFHIAGYKLGIAQITSLSSETLLKRKEEFLNEWLARKNLKTMTLSSL